MSLFYAANVFIYPFVLEYGAALSLSRVEQPPYYINEVIQNTSILDIALTYLEKLEASMANFDVR